MIIDISSDEYMLVITDSGKAYIKGAANERGLGAVILPGSQFFTPIHLPISQKVVQTVTRDSQAILRLDDGSVWAIGSNRNGQLGLGQLRVVNQFVLIALSKPAQYIVMHTFHTLTVLTDGSLWATGNNENGELGLSTTENKRTFTRVTQLSPNKAIIDMAAGYRTSFLVFDDGSLWAAGSNQEFCLGLEKQTDYHTFTHVTKGLLDKQVKQVFNSGTFCTLVLLDDGSLMGCGKNSSGELGLGHDNPIAEFTPITILPCGRKVKAVAMCDSFTLLVLDDNSTWGAGRNLNNRLSSAGGVNLNMLSPFMLLAFLPEKNTIIRRLIIGEDHTVLLMSQSELWAADKSYQNTGLPPRIKYFEEFKPMPLSFDEAGVGLPHSKKMASLQSQALTLYRKQLTISSYEPDAFNKIASQSNETIAAEIFTPDLYGCRVCRQYSKPVIWEGCPYHSRHHPAIRAGESFNVIKPALALIESWIQQAKLLMPQRRYNEAIPLLRQAAEYNSAEACYLLGKYYEKEGSVSNDRWLTYVWYQKAAELGYVQAQFNLALRYDNGDSIAQNKEQAFQWYQKAAEQGYAIAQYYVGVCYENGDGIAQNKEQAFFWYKKAADQNICDAQYNLAVFYETGVGVIQDIPQAICCYRKAAEQGDEDAKKALQRLGVENMKRLKVE